MAARVIYFGRFERQTWVCREIRRKNAITSWAGEKRALRCGVYANRLRRNFLFPVSFQAILCRVVAAQYSTRTRDIVRRTARPKRLLSSNAFCAMHSIMTAKKLKEVLARAERWPEAAQAELAELVGDRCGT